MLAGTLERMIGLVLEPCRLKPPSEHLATTENEIILTRTADTDTMASANFECKFCLYALPVSATLNPKSLCCLECDRTLKLCEAGRKGLLAVGLANHKEAPTEESTALLEEHRGNRSEWKAIDEVPCARKTHAGPLQRE